MRKIFLIGLAVLYLLTSCSKDEEIRRVLKAAELMAPADKSKVSENTASLEWKKNDDSTTKYDIFLGLKAELTDAEKVKSAISQTKFTVENLLSSSTYYWKVKSTNSFGELLDSKVFSFTTGLKASSLTLPTDKAIISENYISLEWTKNADTAAKYDVFLGTKAEITDADKVETATTEVKYLAKALKSSTTYYWKVKTINSDGDMLESSVFSFTTGLKASSLITPADKATISNNTISLEWARNTDVTTKYDVFLGTNAELVDADKVETATSEVRYLAEDLKSSTTYYWKVKSINALGEVLYSKVFSFTTGLKASSLISPVDNAKINDNSVSLSWVRNTDATVTYDVFFGTNAGFVESDKIKTSTSEIEYIAKDLKSSTTYYWKVKTISLLGEVLESKVFSFTTAMKASSLVAPSDRAIITENSVVLKWLKNDDAESTYNVFLGTNASFTDADKVQTSTSEVEYLAKDLKGSTVYYWKVNTINKAGEELESPVFSFSITLGASTLIAPIDKAVIKESTIKLEWSKNDDTAAKYDVFLGTNINFTDVDKLAIGISDLSYLATGIKASTTYYWKVNTINNKGEILESSTYSFSNGLPSTPVLSFPRDKDRFIKLSTNLLWSKATLFNDAVVTYDILYAATADFETAAVKISDIFLTKYHLEGLKENTSYSWKVIARNTDGDIAESEVFTFTTHHTPVTKLLLPTNLFSGAVPEALTWEEEVGFKYNVYLSNGSSEFTPVNMVQALAKNGQYLLNDLATGATYYWKIQAINAVGTEFASATFSFTTDEAALTVKAGTFTDSDGHLYKTTILNGVEWLAENYAFIPTDESLWMIPGKSVGDAAYNDVINDDNYKKYGLLYSIAAITPFIPVGWHVATDKEWNALEVALGMPNDGTWMNGFRGAHAEALKNDDGSWLANSTNTTKMSLVPSGYCTLNWSAPGYPCSKVSDFGKKTYVWTGTEKTTGSYYYRMVNNTDTSKSVTRKLEKSNKLMSVRLVKD
jgi:uncharacterized protein (TIGR02145 family)